MKKIAVYARVSTRDQDPSMQLADLRRYAESRGWTISGEFIDHGISGTKDRRPGLDALMDAARKRAFDGVLCWRFDRIGRSVPHLVNVLAEFNALGIFFTSFSESFDTSTPVGQVMFSVVAAMAAFERQILVERIHGGLRRAKEKGRVPGRPRAVVDVAELRRLKAEGLSCRQLAVAFKVSKDTCRALLRRPVEAAA